MIELWPLRPRRCGARGLPAQEALAAIDRTPLRRFEGNRGFPAALRALGHGFGFRKTRSGRTLALSLACLAALGLVLEILVVEEVLFSRCEHEIRAAIHAFEYAVLKLRHGLFPVSNLSRFSGSGEASQPRLNRTLGSGSLFDFPARLLPVPFAGQGLLDPELLTRFEVEGVTLHFLNNVLLLDLTLKTAKGVF